MSKPLCLKVVSRDPQHISIFLEASRSWRLFSPRLLDPSPRFSGRMERQQPLASQEQLSEVCTWNKDRHLILSPGDLQRISSLFPNSKYDQRTLNKCSTTVSNWNEDIKRGRGNIAGERGKCKPSPRPKTSHRRQKIRCLPDTSYLTSRRVYFVSKIGETNLEKRETENTG